MSQVVLILGSDKDLPHAKKITNKLDELNLSHQTHIASAHKKTKKTLEILENLEQEKKVVLITIAGRSNALSGVCAANSRHPVIACPPFADKVDMMINIHSTLQMPSYVPVLTILEPLNAALAAEKILNN